MNIFETVNNARTYTGCVMGNCYPQEFIPMLIDAWKGGKFPFDELIKKYAATDMQTAVRDTMSGEVIKAVLKWS
jgi:aryl-alcohol dehydrogenase